MFQFDSHDAQGIKNLLDQGHKFTASELTEMLHSALVEVIEGEAKADRVEQLESKVEALEKELNELSAALDDAEGEIRKLSM